MSEQKMKATKVKHMNRIRVDGRLYEWNDLFAAYWSVSGEPRQLQEADLAGATITPA